MLVRVRGLKLKLDRTILAVRGEKLDKEDVLKNRIRHPSGEKGIELLIV